MNKYINELKIGDMIDGIFLAKNVQVRQRNNGEPFISLELADRTGSLPANQWEGFNNLDLAQVKFLQVKGTVSSYQGKSQVTINSSKQVAENVVDLADYLPVTKRDIPEMLAFVKAKAGLVQDPYLNKLLAAMLADAELVERLQKAPAAKALHNAYLGGLLEHVSDLLQIADFITEAYEGINKDLLVTGIIFHDLGKVTELGAGPDLDYTDTGKLLGHNILSMELLEIYGQKVPGFPRSLMVLIKHMILSHHGRPEWGAGKQPMTLEAVVLHYIDNLDSKIRGFQQFVEKDNNLNANWTKKSFMFDNMELFKGALPEAG
ncbi:MAG: HD domain-containing protein [Candidatus Margulisiibacteriota bacterium]|jgi:3'-5' exoribonuclease